jgi:hypothetical protein
VKALRSGALVVLVLVSAVVVVASPAFATPRLTTSTSTRTGRPDNGAVSPFWTPIGSTTTNSITISQRSASGRGLSLTARNADLATGRWTCSTLLATGFPGVTHTRLTISRFDIQECKSDETAAVVTFTTTPPYFLHLSTGPVANSTTGHLEIPPGSGLSYETFLGVPCRVTIRPQSVRLTVTDNLTTLDIRDPTLVFNLDTGDPRVCPDHRTNNRTEIVSGTTIVYAVDTRRTRVTATSPVGG